MIEAVLPKIKTKRRLKPRDPRWKLAAAWIMLMTTLLIWSLIDWLSDPVGKPGLMIIMVGAVAIIRAEVPWLRDADWVHARLHQIYVQQRIAWRIYMISIGLYWIVQIGITVAS